MLTMASSVTNDEEGGASARGRVPNPGAAGGRTGRHVPVNERLVDCSGCGAEHECEAKWRLACGRRCPRGGKPVPVARAADDRVWHHCGTLGVRCMAKKNPQCYHCGELRAEMLADAAGALMHVRQPRGLGAQGAPAGQRVWDKTWSQVFMPLIRAALDTTAPGDAAVRAVDEATFDALAGAVRSRVEARTARLRIEGWDGRGYLARVFQEDILYGPPGEGEAPWEQMAELERLVRAVGCTLTGGGGVDDGPEERAADDPPPAGQEERVPRVVRRVDAVRWAPGLDVAVAEAEFKALTLKRPPSPWVLRKHRRLFGELTVRALNAAADGTAASMRALLALPQIALGNKHRVKERCIGLLLGGAHAAAIIQEAVTIDPVWTRGDGAYDPLAKAAQLAREGRHAEAIRLAADAGAEDIEGTGTADIAAMFAGGGAGVAGGTATDGVPVAAPGVRTASEIVGSIMPSERVKAAEAMMDEMRALPSLRAVSAEGLSGISWDDAMRKCAPGKAAGCDAWRNEMLLVLMGSGAEMAARVAEAMKTFATSVFAGGLDAEARRLFAAARVVMIPKGDGSDRPLGVVGTLRRLVTRGAVRAVIPALTGWLVQRGQFGVGAAAGTEALARAAQQAFDEGKAVLVIDRSNAYPSTEPEPAVAAAQALLPELRGLLETLLGGPAWLTGEGIDRIFWGLFMGCPLSPLIYAIAVELSVDTVRAKLSALQVPSLGFLDDGSLAASEPEALEEAFRLVQQAGERWGQRVNHKKSRLLVGKDLVARFAGVLADVPRVESMKLVGVPVGVAAAREEACVAIGRRATQARRALGKRLRAVEAYYMLRKALGLPRMVHMLRGVPVALTESAAREYDEAMEAEVAGYCGTKPAQLGVLRPTTFMPLRVGGRGGASAVLTAGPAYLGSTVQIKRLLEQVGRVAPPQGATGVTAWKPDRASGRPAPVWLCGGVATCGGSARCRMPKADGCGSGCCVVCCCCTRHGACVGCKEQLSELRKSTEVIDLLKENGVVDAINRAARVVGVTSLKVEDAFVAASVYKAPQRALTCALMSVKVTELHDAVAMRPRERMALRACSQASAYAVWLAAPLVLKSMTNDVFRVAMRQAFALSILSPTALVCKTKAGYEGKCCKLKGIKKEDFAARAEAEPWLADEHAMVCKCGGSQIHTHDGVVRAFAHTAGGWGVWSRMESGKDLPANMRIDNELPLAGDTAGESLMVDWTRRFQGGQATLLAAEREKEDKYEKAFEAPATCRGAAFNEYGELGPHALQVVDRVVSLGARATGSHPADLKVEMLAAIGAAIHFGNAAAYAHFAELNKDCHGFAPRKAALWPAGQRRATGATGQLTGWRGGRGKHRGKGAAVAVAAAVGVAGGGAAAPSVGVEAGAARATVEREAAKAREAEIGGAGEEHPDAALLSDGGVSSTVVNRATV